MQKKKSRVDLETRNDLETDRRSRKSRSRPSASSNSVYISKYQFLNLDLIVNLC